MTPPPDLIPREVLFGNPQRSSPRLSPNGLLMAYIAPDEGVLNVWLRTVGAEDDRPVTADRGRGIRSYFWAQNDRHLLYIQDTKGDENRRDPRLFDLHRVKLESGESSIEAENPGDYVGWLTDHEFRVRGATAATPDGGFQLLVSKQAGGPFEPFLTWGPEDNGGALGFTPDGRGLYIEDSLESDTTELYSIDLDTRERQLLASDARVDVGPVMVHPSEHHVQAVGFALHQLEWTFLDDGIAADFSKLGKVHTGEIGLAGRDRADAAWLVAFTSDRDPVSYYTYDRASGDATYLFSNRPDLEKYSLAPMEPVTIPARDGLELVCYLTRPAGSDRALPLVVNVHGGPWARDEWGYDPEAQWLANRGYAVLQVNFRGSTGFGKKFLNAGNREWGAKMHDDLLDAVDWAVAEGVADRAKVCIYGGSYGGYAALVGAAFTPRVFTCAVDIVGPSNICTLIESIPAYWAPLMHTFRVRVGDIETEREFLDSRSPLFKARDIRIPMLIAQGANDPRVKRAESEQIVEALRAKGKDVEYLLFDDEGHGFAVPENRMAFYAGVEQFLARHLGGRVEDASVAEAERLAQVRQGSGV